VDLSQLCFLLSHSGMYVQVLALCFAQGLSSPRDVALAQLVSPRYYQVGRHAPLQLQLQPGHQVGFAPAETRRKLTGIVACHPGKFVYFPCMASSASP